MFLYDSLFVYVLASQQLNIPSRRVILAPQWFCSNHTRSIFTSAPFWCDLCPNGCIWLPQQLCMASRWVQSASQWIGPASQWLISASQWVTAASQQFLCLCPDCITLFMVQLVLLHYMYSISVQSLYLNSLSIVGDWMGGGYKTFC